jgi:hypothetical protein
MWSLKNGQRDIQAEGQRGKQGGPILRPYINVSAKETC